MICGTINRTFRNKELEDIKIKFYKTIFYCMVVKHGSGPSIHGYFPPVLHSQLLQILLNSPMDAALVSYPPTSSIPPYSFLVRATFHFHTSLLACPLSYIFVLTFMPTALDLKMCFRLQYHLLPAAFLGLISSIMSLF